MHLDSGAAAPGIRRAGWQWPSMRSSVARPAPSPAPGRRPAPVLGPGPAVLIVHYLKDQLEGPDLQLQTFKVINRALLVPSLCAVVHAVSDSEEGPIEDLTGPPGTPGEY